MGMFDYLKSSYDLGPQFTDVILQTKGIEDGYDGTMSNYWIAPDGYLWVGSYAGCHTLEVYEKGDAKYNPKFKWGNWEWIPTGEKGTYRVHPITKYVEIYPAEWAGKHEDWPQLRLHFKNGKLQDFHTLK